MCIEEASNEYIQGKPRPLGDCKKFYEGFTMTSIILCLEAAILHPASSVLFPLVAVPVHTPAAPSQAGGMAAVLTVTVTSCAAAAAGPI